MLGIVGILVVLVMVFGGYTMAGGKFGIIVYALPFELTMIGGGALGAFLIANSGANAKQTVRDIGKVFRGPTGSPPTTATCCAFCSNSFASRARTPSRWKSISRTPQSPRSSRAIRRS